MGKALFPRHTQGESAVGWGAGGSSTGPGPQVSRYHGQPLPSLALGTHLAPGAGQGREGEAGADTGPLCPAPHAARPRNPSPPWPQGAHCPPGRGKNSGWSRESGQCPGSAAFWPSSLGPVPPGSAPGFLISKMRYGERDSGSGGGIRRKENWC